MRDNMDERVLVSVPEAARRWSVSERMVWLAIQEGRLQKVKLGRATRIHISEVERVAREGLAAGAR